MDLGALWRSRCWRKLLNFIDHLPRTTWFSQAVANDEEHARLLAEARKEAPESERDEGPWRPSMLTYSAEVEALHWLVNELRGYRADFVNANRDPKKSSPVKSPFMLLGPNTALERIGHELEIERRDRRHSRLVSMLLPNGPQPMDPETDL